MTDLDAASEQQPWLHLDKRMLLIHPVNEAVRFVPVLVASVAFGSRSGNHVWSVFALAAIVCFALLRWFTTSYRIGRAQIELRTGLFSKKRLSIPRDRVRSVDIEANVLHRALGLAVLHVGTGKQVDKNERFTLNALDARRAPELRARLLAHTASQGDAAATAAPRSAASAAAASQGAASVTATSQGTASVTAATDAASSAPVGAEIGHWRASWVRYAPFSFTGLALFAPVIGLAFQYGLTDKIFRSSLLTGTVESAERGGAGIVTIVAAGLFALAVVASLAACARYLATYHRLRVLDDGQTLHSTHGLFTTRQVTMDRSKLRGATMNEPLLLRLVGGAQLEAIMTGTSSHQRVLPQAPRAEVERVMAYLLGGDTYATTPLSKHGAAARRRRYTRTLLPVLTVGVAMLIVRGLGLWMPWWTFLVLVVVIAAACALAEDRYRGLGHAVLAPEPAEAMRWLVSRNGSLDRDRDCLEAAGIIGWTVRQSPFQRRAGLATVIAATPAGKRRYRVVDVPIARAWTLVDTVTPHMSGPR